MAEHYTDEDVRVVAEVLLADYASQYDYTYLAWPEFAEPAKTVLDAVAPAIAARAAARAWSEGHAAGREYQGDGWNSDAHDPDEDNPYRADEIEASMSDRQTTIEDEARYIAHLYDVRPSVARIKRIEERLAAVYDANRVDESAIAARAWDEGYTIGNRHDGRRDANPYLTTDESGAVLALESRADEIEGR